MARQVPISFKDLAVWFSEEEWRLLEERQREFYRDVMRENYETLVSVGTAELLPLSAFLSPTKPGGAMGGGSHTDEGQETPARGSPQGGQPQHSLHLSALVQLVKGIPEFLFGEVKDTEDSPESRGTSLDGERASPEVTCTPQGLRSCLPDSPVSCPSLATTPASSSSSSDLPADGGQGRPLLIKTAHTPWPAGRGGPETPGEEPSPPTCSPGQRKSYQTQERGTTETEISPGNSPLQGLINCLKEILVPGSQHPEAAPNLLPPVPILGASRPTTVELGLGSPPWPVKTESPSGDRPLQGLLNFLKEIPEAQDRCPSPSGIGDLRLQEDPGVLKRNSGGPRHLQISHSHPGPGAGCTFPVVKVEDSWSQSPLAPTSCQLSRQRHGLSATGDAKGIRTPCWGPTAQASRASSSPLAALEACLKGIPPGGSSPSRTLATTWSRSPQPGNAGSQRSELRPQGTHGEEANREPLLPLGLQGCVREGPAQPPGPQGTPTSVSSACSIDGDLDFGSPAGSQGQRPGKGCLPGSSPLQGLENCLKELPVPRQQPARSCSSAADREPRRAEPKSWIACKEGPRAEASEPSCLRQRGEVPTRSLHLPSPQIFTSSCHQQGFGEQGTIRPEPWRWLQDGEATRPSPLHCLESSLRGILPVRPLRFSCLVGPGPAPSPSPSPGSSSSLSSSDGEDARMEPELWPPPLQEIEHLRGCKHPVALSPGPGRSPRGSSSSSPSEGPERRELKDCSGLGAGKAEEGTGGKSQSPRREEGEESAHLPSSAGGGRDATGHSWPVPLLEERSRPRASEEPRSLEPGCGRHSVSARTQRRQLPQDPPEPTDKSPAPAAVSPLWPATSPQPPCSCGKPLQQELHSLGAALTEKLDQLATALAGLAQEVATMRNQVDRLGRRPQGPGPKRQASWPWSLPRGPRWAHGLGQRHLPYWRQKRPTRPKPKILRVQAEGCRTGDPLGLSRGRVHLVPPDTPPAEPSRPRPSTSQQPPSAASCHTVLTGHPLLGQAGCIQSPLPTFVPAALPP